MVGGRHGSALCDYDQGDAPCPDLLRKGRRWPSAVSLTWPQQSVEDGPRTFEPDRAGIEINLAEAERELAADHRQGRYSRLIVGTFTGEVRSRKDVRIFQSDEGWFYGTGYGQGGKYPAHLVIKAVTDVTLIEKDKWKRRQQK